MICHSNRCIFIHIPRTAGQSIENILLSLEGIDVNDRFVRKRHAASHLKQYENLLCFDGRQHCTSKEILFLEEMLHKDYFKFAFIRNPWDRLVSEYFYFMGPGRVFIEREINNMDSFENFVRSQSYENIRRHGWLQCKYIIDDKNGKPLVDFIGRFENLQTPVQ